MTSFESIVFMDGEEGREVVDRLERVDGVVAGGASAETIEATVQHLLQWDTGEGERRPERSAGSADRVVELGDLILSWNLGLGYIGLERRHD